MTTADEPNVIKSLKIQVDNDKLIEPKDFSEESMDDEVEEGEASSGDEDEVEVNVIVGNDKQDECQKTDGYFSRKKSDPHTVNKAREFDFYRPPAVRNRPRLDNVDSKSKFNEPKENITAYPSLYEEIELDLSPDNTPNEILLEERAKRFGVHSSNKPSKKDMQELYKSLDLNEYDFHRGGFRADAVHVKGIENLRSSQIFNYFKDYPPQSLEWLNDSSCNIIWNKKEEAAAALLGLSCPIKASKNIKNNAKLRNRKAGKNKEPNESSKVKTETSERKKGAKTPEREKSSSSSGSSSSSDDSSDSDDDDSSSSNSSSSGSSSDSNSDSTDSSDSSSDSSSESEDEEKVPAKGNNKEGAAPVEEGGDVQTNNNNSDINHNNNNDGDEETPQQMEVDESTNSHPQTPTAELDGSVLPEEISIPVPPGRWRLGVPCPNVKAILMRYAHCKDKKVPGLEKPIELYQNYRERKKRKRHESVKNDVSLHHRFRKTQRPHRTMSDSMRSQAGGPQLSPPKRPHQEWFEKPPSQDQRGYKDLDDPLDENKNPWGFLAQNWGRKETQDNLDYQELLREHVTGQKRKRSVSVSDDEPQDYRPYRPRQQHIDQNKRRRQEYRYDYDSEDVDENDDENEEIVAWNSRIKLPFMRMHADAEEKKKEKSLKGSKKGIGSRLSRKGSSGSMGSMRLFGSVRIPSARPVSKDGDLRTKLRMKMRSN